MGIRVRCRLGEINPAGPLIVVQCSLINGYPDSGMCSSLVCCEKDLQRVEMLDLQFDGIISNVKFNG